MTKKRLFAPTTLGLGAMRRAAMTLLLAMLTATTAWAQSSFSGGSGTKADPYKISSSADLVQLATDINNSTSRLYEDQYFVQTGNIDMSGINFVPIGINDDNNNHKFRSNYNGQNYTISNLTVNGSYDYAGLFGYFYNGDIDNVRLVSPSITNTKTGYTGALVGYGNMPGIHNCLVINPTLSGGNSIGVFAGKQAAGNIQYTYYTGNNNYSNVGSTDGSNANTSIGHAYALTLSGGATTSTTAAFTYNSTDYYAGTITLSNAAPAGWIYAYTVNGSPIDGTSFTINADATVALSRTPDPTHFSVNDAGTEYTIHTATGWSVFCDCLDDNDTYNRFSGKTVKLGDDIRVTRMAGSEGNPFTGTFDGGGKTLTVNYANTGNNTMTAPFSYVDGATIQNLIVGGTISGTAYRAAGIIGETVNATSHITNCVSSVNISSDRYTGGFSIGGNVEIEGCMFNGKINGTAKSGGFIGYSNSAQVIKNSLFAPQDGSSISGGTFYFNGGGDVAPVNSYYTQALGIAQGKACHSVTAGDNVTIEAVDITSGAVWYNVSGIVAYSSGGLYRDGNLYYGSGDQLSLTLSNSVAGAPQGYQYGYTASAGTLSGTTLTMPDADVTISVNTAALALIDWATVNKGNSADPYMIYNKDQLLLLAHRVNGTNGETANDYKGKYFKLGADITFTHPDNEGDDYAENYEAIGRYDSGTLRYFNGYFNGDNHTVSGIRIRKTGSGDADIYQGLFGLIGSGADIYDVHLTDARIKGYECVGGIVGCNNKGYIMRCSVTDSYITATYNSNYGTICGRTLYTSRLSNNYYHGCTVNGTAVTSGKGCQGADITANNGALPAYAITLGDGVSTTALASAPENGFVYNGVSYYREGLALPLASTLGSEVPEGYTPTFSANGTAFSGNTYTVNATDGDVTITAALRSDGQQHEVSYVDADGTTQTAQAIALDGTETTLAAGWYFVGKDIDYTATVTLGGNVNLILADGCTMNIGTNDNKINDYGIHGYINNSNQFDLTIYGQSLGTGDLNIYTTGSDYHHAILVNNLTINGGIVTAITNDSKATALYAASDLTINGGNVTATGTGWNTGIGILGFNSVTINGGNVTANGSNYGITARSGVVTINGGNVTANGSINGIYAWVSSGTITLGWTRPDDRITASSISTEGGTVAVATGQALTDGSGNIYTGTLTDDEISAIAGKTLRPCISYLDSDGETQYCADYTVLTGDETKITTAGWYVATGTLNYTGTLTFQNTGDFHLILADGCQMNIGTSESRLNGVGIECIWGTLTIYGQSTGDDIGNLSIYATGTNTHGICVSNALTINGGHITANTDGFCAYALFSRSGDITINGGNVEATTTGGDATEAIYAHGTFNYNGGNVTVAAAHKNAICASGGCYNFSWSDPNDCITIGSTGLYIKDGATATFNSLFTDGEGNYYSGTLTGDEINVLAGKTLVGTHLLDDTADAPSAALDGQTVNVTLANRTIDTEWNTLTVPFDASAEQLTETFGEGVKLYELSGSTLDNGVLGLEFTSATSIEAGKPYFIKASADVVNPTFRNVTIEASANSPSETDYVDFIPTLGVTTVEGSDLREVLVLGGGNTLYNPSVLPAMMKGFRGFFRVHEEVVANAAQFRMTFAEESDVTGIIDVQVKNEELRNKSCDAVYNLMGQRVNAATAREIHVVKGKRVIRP